MKLEISDGALDIEDEDYAAIFVPSEDCIYYSVWAPVPCADWQKEDGQDRCWYTPLPAMVMEGIP